VERAFSHHRMFQRFQEEGRALGFKVNDFATDILTEMDLIKKGGKGHYLSPSIYLPTLKNWITTFGKDQIRVYFAEDLAVNETASWYKMPWGFNSGQSNWMASVASFSGNNPQ